MASLFLPVALTTIAVPTMLGLDDIWLTVSLTLVGILLSAVISEPLRRFILAWGDLAPVKTTCGRTTDARGPINAE